MKKAIIVIDVIDVKNEKDEEIMKLKSEIYVEDSEGKVTKYTEELIDTDLSLITTRSEAAAVEAMGGKKEDDDAVTISISNKVVGMILNNEFNSFKESLIFHVNRLKDSVKASVEVMDYTDEQKSFATAFEKAVDHLVSKI